MKQTRLAIVIAALTPMLALAQQGDRRPPANMEDMMKAMGALMSGGTNATAIVDFRELKALLPAALDGMKRTNASGEKSGALGMTVAFAEGTYEAETGGNIHIKISDNAGIGGFMAFAQAGWAASEVDRESDTGFERTTTYGQHKAREEYDTSSKSGKVEILVGGRFMVEVNGNDVGWEAIQAAAKKVGIDQIGGVEAATGSYPLATEVSQRRCSNKGLLGSNSAIFFLTRMISIVRTKDKTRSEVVNGLKHIGVHRGTK